MAQVLLFAAMCVLAPVTILVIVRMLVDRQNQRVLASRADRSLQAMLHAGDFLGELARDASVSEDLRRRAESLARDYPNGDQLRIFAERLLGDLRRSAPQQLP